MFGSMLSGPGGVIEAGHRRRREGLERFRARFGFPRRLSGPLVGLEEALYIGSGVDFVIMTSLQNVDAVEISSQTKFLKGDGGLVGKL